MNKFDSLDSFSYRCGVIDAFNEVVKAGVKRIALSHPTDTLAECQALIPFSEQICRQYGNHFYVEEEPLLTAGREVLLLVVNGDYEAVHERLRADQQEAVTVEDIQSMALSALDGAGDYVEIQDSMVTGQSSDGESYGVAVFYCGYTDADVIFRLAFDPDMELIGISMQQR